MPAPRGPLGRLGGPRAPVRQQPGQDVQMPPKRRRSEGVPSPRAPGRAGPLQDLEVASLCMRGGVFSYLFNERRGGEENKEAFFALTRKEKGGGGVDMLKRVRTKSRLKLWVGWVGNHCLFSEGRRKRLNKQKQALREIYLKFSIKKKHPSRCVHACIHVNRRWKSACDGRDDVIETKPC